jgi:hypothetical protein
VERPGDAIRIIRTSGTKAESSVTASALQDIVAAVRAINSDVLPSCIEGSAAVRDFLVGLKIDATCVPVRLHVANRTFRELFQRGQLPENEISQRALGAIFEQSSVEELDAHWGGHLVVLVENYWIVDPTLDQVNTLEPTFRLTPIVADSGEELVTRGVSSVPFDDDIVTYERDSDNERYRQAPAWSDRKARMERYFYRGGVH